MNVMCSVIGQDSSGGKTGSTKSGSGPLDFFGGSSSQSSIPSSASDQLPVSLATINNPLVFVEGAKTSLEDSLGLGLLPA